MESENQIPYEPTDKEKRAARRAFPTTSPGPYYDKQDVERWYFRKSTELEKEHKD